MTKIKLDNVDIEIYKKTQLGRVYLKYYEVTGGDPIGLTIPYGYPKGIETEKDIIRTYLKCIDKGITWQEELEVEEPPKDAII